MGHSAIVLQHQKKSTTKRKPDTLEIQSNQVDSEKKYFKQNDDHVVTKVLFTMVSPTGFEPVTH